MPTFTVTGGSVTVEDGRPGVNPDPNGSFAPARKISVTQFYDLEPNADARRALEEVGLLAHAEVRRLLHQTVEPIERAEAALLAATQVPAGEHVRSAQVANHDKTLAGLDAIPGADAGVNDPADVDAKIAAAVAKAAPRKAANRKANGYKEPTAEAAGSGAGEGAATTETASNDPAPVALDAVPGISDPVDFSVGEELPEITDADLNDAVATRNGIIKNPDAIRELIATYRTGVGRFHVSMIAPESRADFLAKLGVLK